MSYGFTLHDQTSSPPTHFCSHHFREEISFSKVTSELIKSYSPFLVIFLLVCVWAKVLQSYLTLCDPMDCGLPGSSVMGTLQARILEWVVMPSSRGSSQPRDQTHVSYVFCIGRQVLYN